MTEEDVYIEVEDIQCDIGISATEDIFDGFDTVYPASVILTPII